MVQKNFTISSFWVCFLKAISDASSEPAYHTKAKFAKTNQVDLLTD